MFEEGITEEEINEYLHKNMLLIITEDKESRKFMTLLEASKFMDISRKTVEYAYYTKRPVITRRLRVVKVFHIKWLNSKDVVKN